MHLKFKYLLYTLSCILFLHCAQQGVPTGGPKDILPPKDSLFVPSNFSTNFQSKEIKILFDEYVKIAKPNQIYMFPKPSVAPDIRVAGKWIVIKLKENLLPNTTYQIIFDHAIADITEGNVLNKLTYVFSTGEVIDSLQIKGKVIDAETLVPLEKITVFLFSGLTNDSFLISGRYDFATVTDQNGAFEFGHLSSKPFRVFAIEDKNNNAVAEENEKSGFIDTIISPSVKQENEYVIRLARPKPKNIFIKEKKEIQTGKLLILFNYPPDTIEIFPVDKAQTLYYQSGKDSLWIFFNNDFSDTLNFILKYGPEKDTIQHIFQMKKTEKIPLQINLNYFLNKDPGCIYLTVGYPFEKIDTSRINLYQLNRKDTVPIRFSLYRMDSFNFGLCPQSQLKGKFLLQFDTAAITFGKYAFNPPESFTTDVSDPEALSTIEIKFDTIFTNARLELRKENKVLLDEKVVGKALKWTHIPPGKYEIYLYLDENNNHKWDAGSVYPPKKPEKRYKYAGELQLKPGWTQEIIWKISN